MISDCSLDLLIEYNAGEPSRETPLNKIRWLRGARNTSYLHFHSFLPICRYYSCCLASGCPQLSSARYLVPPLQFMPVSCWNLMNRVNFEAFLPKREVCLCGLLRQSGLDHFEGKGLASRFWSVWFIWFVWSIWFNQTNETNEIDQMNQIAEGVQHDRGVGRDSRRR